MSGWSSGQTTGIGMPPPPPPMMTPQPEPIAPPRKGNALAGLALALGAAGIALALVGMVMFPGPAGAAGAQGLKGDKGDTGDVGPAGATGADGISCWDLNGNGGPDLATEDANHDGTVNVLDCRGPAGPGTVMASSVGGTVDLTTSCDPLMQVTITVPSSGNLTVQSWMYSILEHTVGTADSFGFKLSQTSIDCFVDPYLGVFLVPSNLPTASYAQTDTSQRVDSVTAGTYTYYLTGEMFAGYNSGDRMVRGNIVAVFYPG